MQGELLPVTVHELLKQYGNDKLRSSSDQWLQTTLAATPVERETRLLAWESAPAARTAHPREEHLIPLMVAVGAAFDEASTCVYHEDGVFGGVTASSFRFGAVPQPAA